MQIWKIDVKKFLMQERKLFQRACLLLSLSLSSLLLSLSLSLSLSLLSLSLSPSLSLFSSLSP